MKWRGWTATGGTIVAVLAGTAAATGSLNEIAGSPLFNIATRAYVAETISVVQATLSEQVDQLGGKVDGMANLMADQMISNLEFQLEAARRGLVVAEQDAAEHPGIASLRVLRMAAQGRVDDLTDQLIRARCYRIAIISAQDSDCRN